MNQIREFFEKNEKKLSPLFLIGGFILDNLTIRRSDLLAENLVVLLYLVLSGVCIILMNLIEAEKIKGNFWQTIKPWIDFAISFAFGGLFSIFIVFYSKSSAITHSFPFLVLLLVVMISTEFMKKQYNRLATQVSVYFLALFSVSIYGLPILFEKMSDFIFILGGIVSLVITSVLIFVLRKLVPERIKQFQLRTIISVLIIFVALNVMYFTNIIPPIPLALREISLHSGVIKNGDAYTLGEIEKKFNWLGLQDEFSVKAGSPLYVYSSVFAPTKLNTNIAHNWQYKNAKGKWVSASRINFSIYGGRDGGYRGYTFKNNLTAGEWRVRVENGRGQVIGQKYFKVNIISEK